MHSACMWQPPWWMRQLLASGGRDIGMRGALGGPCIHPFIWVLIIYSPQPQDPHPVCPSALPSLPEITETRPLVPHTPKVGIPASPWHSSPSPV